MKVAGFKANMKQTLKWHMNASPRGDEIQGDWSLVYAECAPLAGDDTLTMVLPWPVKDAAALLLEVLDGIQNKKFTVLASVSFTDV
jgi:hypothetical protein